MAPFVKATKKRSKARIAIDGPSGSGKTYTALIAATVLADGGKIAVIDTERESASLYSDKFSFDVAPLNTFNPQNYIDLIRAAEDGGYSVIVIDSLSHAWEGEGGVLDLHDQATKRQRTENSYTAWKDVTPIHRKLIDAMLQSKCHVIATMRSKMEYSQEKDERTGKTTIRKIGMAPIQRQGMEYEFTIVGDMDIDHNIVISKSRCEVLSDKVETKPGAKFWGVLRDWLNAGDDPTSDRMSSEPEHIEAQPASPELPKPESPRQTYRVAKVKFNGMTPEQWHKRCADFSAANPYWETAAMEPDMNHILGSAGGAGYEYITGENVDAMFADIVKAHETKSAD